MSEIAESALTERTTSEQATPSHRPYTAKANAPWTELAQDRARCPVAHSAELDAIQVTTYEAVKEVQRNHGAFSSTYSAMWPLPEPVPEEQQVFSLADPPRHTRQRRLVTKALSASRIARMRPFTERKVNDLIDAVAAKGETFDMNADFAIPMSEGHIAELLGVPEENREYFLRMSHRFMNSTTSVNHEGLADPELAQWLQDLQQVVRDRRAAGPVSDDLTTALAFAEDDGDMFDENEIALVMLGLFAAGNTSTSTAVVNIVRVLDQFPEQKAKFLADIDGLVLNVVEEGLRYDGPILGLWRRTMKEAPITDKVSACPGDRIYFSHAAASHDPEVFDRPDEFIIGRDWKKSPSSMAFGYGIHHCIGMNLGRLQTEVALSTLYKRLPDLQVRPGFEPQQIPGPVIRAWTSLEMVYDGPALPRTDI